MNWRVLPLALGTLALVGCAGPLPQIGSWTALTELPQARTEHNVVALDGSIYVAGGFASASQLTTTFHIYDPAEDAWSEGAPLPAARHHAALVAHDGKVYLLGGYAGVGFGAWVPQDNLWIYDVEAGSWNEGPPLPAPLGAHAAAVTADGMIHVVGGVGEAGTAGLPDDHFVYDTTNQTWSTAAPLPTPREHLGAAYHDGTLYVAAGRTMQDSALRTFEAYDVATGEWARLADVPTGRSGIAVTAFDGQIYVFGGEAFAPTARTFNAAERYDPDSDSWEAVTPMPTSRHGMGAGVVDGAIYVIGGGPQAALTVSGVNERWTP